MKDGDFAVEELVELDDARRALGYKVLTELSSVTDLHHRIVVDPCNGGTLSLVTFSAQFQPAASALVKEVADRIGAAFISAANGLGRHLGVDVHVVVVNLCPDAQR